MTGASRISLYARRYPLSYITENPAEAVELPDMESVERGTFAPAEVRMLEDAAKGEWRTLFLLAYFTVARLGDCCAAWEDIDLVGGSLAYTQGKTGLKLTVPLHPDLLAHLEALAGTDQPSPFVMPSMADKKPGGRKGLSESFKVIVRRAGLDLQTVSKAEARGCFPSAPSTPSATVSRASWQTRALHQNCG